MYTFIYTHIYICIHIQIYVHPTQSMIYVHLLVARFLKIILFIVEYKYSKSYAKDQMLQIQILRTWLCGTGCITHSGWLIHFHPTKMVGRNCFVPVKYQFPKGTLAGLALVYICIMNGSSRYIYIYKHIYVYTYIHTCIHIYTYLHKYMYMYIHIHTCIYIYTYIYICIYIYGCMYLDMYIHISMYITYIYAYTYIFA